MKILFYDGIEFRQYLDTNVYSSRKGDIITSNFKRTKQIGYFKQSKRGGYLRITTSINSKTIAFASHRVVATCWIPNPDNKPQVNHIDGNKLNNNDWNLEWNTPKENTIHSIITGLSVREKGDKCAHFGKRGGETNRAKKVIDIETNIIYSSLKEACLTTEFNYKYVSRMLSGEKKNKTNLRYV